MYSKNQQLSLLIAYHVVSYTVNANHILLLALTPYRKLSYGDMFLEWGE